MGNPVPIQTRAVDPYTSYDSSEINKITRIVTGGRDLILKSAPLAFEIESDVIVEMIPGGVVVKDDIMINLEGLMIDFSDNDFYVNDSLGHWSEDGYHYIVLDYVYSKSKPAPEASIKIILPSQRNNPAIFNAEAHMLLKVVKVLTETGTRKIKELSDYDPENPSNSIETTSNGTKFITANDYTISSDDRNIILSGPGDKIVRSIACKLCETLSIINLDDTSKVTIYPAVSDTIDGQSQYIYTLVNTYLNIISDKTHNWEIVSNQSIAHPKFYNQAIIDATEDDDIIISEYNDTTYVNLPLAEISKKPLSIINKTGELITINAFSGDLLNGQTDPVDLTELYDSITFIPYADGWIYSRQSQNPAGDTDTKELKVSSNDTTPAFLSDKIVAGANITLAILNDGANETIQINGSAGGVAGTTQVKVSASDVSEQYLLDKLVAGANVVITKGDNAGVEFLSISSTGGGGGGDSLILTNITASYTALATDTHIIAKPTATIAITLYSAAICTLPLKIVNLSNVGASIIINANASDTIEGNSSTTLLNKYDSISLISDQVNTWITL